MYLRCTCGGVHSRQLCDVSWQAYGAYGIAYDHDAQRAFYPYLSTAGERLMDLLDDELRAAAVSRDDKIRWEASALPRRLAGEALAEGATLTIEQSLGALIGAYAAAVSDLTEDGREELPETRDARARVQAPFQSLPSFTHSDLASAIERAASFELDPGPASEAAGIAESARLAAAQLPVAHRQLVEMLRNAITLRDSATVREALAAWRNAGVAAAERQTPAPAALRHRVTSTSPSKLLRLCGNLESPWGQHATAWTR